MISRSNELHIQVAEVITHALIDSLDRVSPGWEKCETKWRLRNWYCTVILHNLHLHHAILYSLMIIEEEDLGKEFKPDFLEEHEVRSLSDFVPLGTFTHKKGERFRFLQRLSEILVLAGAISLEKCIPLLYE